MGVHCLFCGGQLPPDAKEPLCVYCKTLLVKEAIHREPIWALRVMLEALADTINDIKTDIRTIKEEQKEITKAVKLKP